MQVRRRGTRHNGQWRGQSDPPQPSQLQTNLPPPQPTPLSPDPPQPSKLGARHGRGRGRPRSSHLHASSPQPTLLSADPPQPALLSADPPQPTLLSSDPPPQPTPLSPDPPQPSKLGARHGRGRGRPRSSHLRASSPQPTLLSADPPQPTPLSPDPPQPSKLGARHGRGRGRPRSSLLRASSPQPTRLSADPPQPTLLYSDPPQPTLLSPDPPQPTLLSLDPPQVSKQHTGHGRGKGLPQSSHLHSSSPPPQLSPLPLDPPQPTSPYADPPQPSKQHTRSGRGKGRMKSSHLRTSFPPLQPTTLSPDRSQHTPLFPDPPQPSKQHTRHSRGEGHPQSSHLHTSSPPPQPTSLFPHLPQPSKPCTRQRRGEGRPQSSQLCSSSPPSEPTPNIPVMFGTTVASPLISGGLSNSSSCSSDSPSNLSNSAAHSSDSPSNHPILMPSYGGSQGEFDRRKVISVEAVSNPRRFIPQSVTRDIITTVIMELPIPAEKWHNYPIDTKNKLFKDFMDKYKFTSDYDRNIARTVWERTCKDRYPDYLKNMRKMALKQANSTNLADTKGLRPKGIKAEIWNGLVDIWLSPGWRNKSDACRRNRWANPDAVLHTGGSISFGEHKKRMEAELKQPVSARDVYDHVHKTKDGEYVSQYSKKFIESYDNAMSRKYGRDPSRHPVVDPEVWAVSGPNKKVSGSNKKRRIVVGNSLDINIDEPTPGSSSQVPDPSRTVAPTPAQGGIKEAVDSAMSTFVQSQLVPMLEPILSRIVASQVKNFVTPQGGGVSGDDLDDD